MLKITKKWCALPKMSLYEFVFYNTVNACIQTLINNQNTTKRACAKYHTFNAFHFPPLSPYLA